jgi:tRNA dimethylallyltransferase
MKKHPSVLVIAGPTAVGKTAAAIEVARHFGTEIISADSRQCYRELNIGVARPHKDELDQVPHHFIASHSIQQEVTAAGFADYAMEVAHRLFQQHDQVVMAGGTGLYIRAFCEGLDDIPDVSAELRGLIQDSYAQKGLTWLQAEVAAKDPLFYQKGEILNPQRLMRALEVVEATGQSILSFHTGQQQERPFRSIRIALDLPREELYARINTRVDKMMEAGLLEEVKSLYPYRSLNALQTVGYAELFAYLDGTHSLERAVELIKQNTRRYAKRQLTWLRRMTDIQWFHPADTTGIINFFSQHLQER